MGTPRTREGAWFVAALLLSLVSRVAAATTCNCQKVALTASLVCGTDGVTYVNECVAKCQDVMVASKGGCGGKEPFSTKLLDTTSTITAAGMKKFSSEGYRFLAKMTLLPGNCTEPGVAARGVKSPSQTGGDLAVLRILPTGHLYGLLGSVARQIDARTDSVRRQMPFAGSSTTVRRASWRLMVAGTDDRYEKTSANGAHDWPWRAVGRVGGGCSGALIHPYTVLSAGHCVWSTASKAFYANLDFIPDRHDGGNHCDKYNKKNQCTKYYSDKVAKWTMVTTWFSKAGPPVQCDDGTMKCQTQDDFTWDVSIIQLAEPIGNTYGYFGLGYDCGSIPYLVWSAGYPSDKPGGMTHMWVTYGWLNTFKGCVPKGDSAYLANSFISSDLDTAPGQSGSAIWDLDKYVRAVHVSGGPGHRTISQWVYNWILTVLK